MNEIVTIPTWENSSWIKWSKVSEFLRTVWEKLNLLTPEYPKWKHLVPENPSLDQAREAWRIITKCQIVFDPSEEEFLMSQLWWREEIKIISDTEIQCEWEIYTLERTAWYQGHYGVYYNKWYYPEECKIEWSHSDDIGNEGLTYTLPNGVVVRDSGFWEYTDTPNTKENFYYPGGWCGWWTDEDGNRYHQIDKNTWLPHNWERAKAVETFRNYVLNVAHWDMIEFIWKS